MQIKVAILGYGNLGKAVEDKLLCENKIKLVGIFTKRNNVVSLNNTPVYNRDNLLDFVNKIDLLILCSGSKTDMLLDAPYYTQFFNTINTFDTHKLIPQMFQKLNNVAQSNGHIAILSAGWDPGLFSCIKATFNQILTTPCTCFWGKGVSMGHSQAIKQIKGVTNALSFTVPNKAAKKLAIKGKTINTYLHHRKVYIVSNNKQNNKAIKNKVVNMPNYFKGQKVKVAFISNKKLNKIKKLSHKGDVICANKTCCMHLQVKMHSNPDFTASIVTSYVRAFNNIKNKYTSGAYTPLHFSPMDLSTQTELKTIKKYC